MREREREREEKTGVGEIECDGDDYLAREIHTCESTLLVISTREKNLTKLALDCLRSDKMALGFVFGKWNYAIYFL